MTYDLLATALIFTALLVPACGGDPGDPTGGGSTGVSATATTTATTGEPATSGVTTGPTSTGESGSATQGQTDTGATSTGVADASTGEPGTSSTGPGSGESDSSGTGAGSGESDSSGTGAGLCAGFEPPGCMEKGCPEGQECKVLDDECVSSDCTCDAGTGEIVCSPDCEGGSCVPVCADILCDLFCENGFKQDANGCDICECNEPPACECAVDTDCVKTSPGCCPCNAGGMEAPAHKDCVDQVMMCDIPPDQVNCPRVFLCTDSQPACVDGQCVLQ